MKHTVYRELFRINHGFDAVLRGLDRLHNHAVFHPSELRRFRALAREARASTNSYLTAVLESAETDDAGRLFRKRLRREKEDENAENAY